MVITLVLFFCLVFILSVIVSVTPEDSRERIQLLVPLCLWLFFTIATVSAYGPLVGTVISFIIGAYYAFDYFFIYRGTI